MKPVLPTVKFNVEFFMFIPWNLPSRESHFNYRNCAIPSCSATIMYILHILFVFLFVFYTPANGQGLAPSPGFQTSFSIPVVVATSTPTTITDIPTASGTPSSANGLTDQEKIIVIAATVGGAAVLAILGLVIFFTVRRRRRQKSSSNFDESIEESSTGLFQKEKKIKKLDELAGTQQDTTTRMPLLSDNQYEKKIAAWRDSYATAATFVDAQDVDLQASGIKDPSTQMRLSRLGNSKHSTIAEALPVVGIAVATGVVVSHHERNKVEGARSRSSTLPEQANMVSAIPRISESSSKRDSNQRSSIASARTAEWLDSESPLAGAVLPLELSSDEHRGILRPDDMKRIVSKGSRKSKHSPKSNTPASSTSDHRSKTHSSTKNPIVTSQGGRKSVELVDQDPSKGYAVPVGFGVAAAAATSGVAGLDLLETKVNRPRTKHVSSNVSHKPTAGFPVPVIANTLSSGQKSDGFPVPRVPVRNKVLQRVSTGGFIQPMSARSKDRKHQHRHTMRAVPSLGAPLPLSKINRPNSRGRPLKLSSDDDTDALWGNTELLTPTTDEQFMERIPTHMSEQTGQVLLSDDNAGDPMITVKKEDIAIPDEGSYVGYENEDGEIYGDEVGISESEESICSSCMSPGDRSSWFPRAGIAEETEEELLAEEDNGSVEEEDEDYDDYAQDSGNEIMEEHLDQPVPPQPVPPQPIRTGSEELFIEEESIKTSEGHGWMSKVLADMDRRVSRIK